MVCRIRLGFLAALALWSGGGATAGPAGPATTRFLPGQLGGVETLLRYEIARPDRTETRLLFLTGAPTRAQPPQEVQVVGPDGTVTHLSDEDGGDCTLAHVEVVTGPRAMVVSAVRVFPADPPGRDQSQPAAMMVQVYRPVAGGDVGESAVVLRAAGPARRTPPVCAAADVRAAMLRLATTP